EVGKWKGHEDKVWDLACRADGKQAASIAESGRECTIWDLESGRELVNVRRSAGEIRALAISPNGRRILTTKGDLSHLWDGGTGALVLSLPNHGFGRVTDMAFSPDGSLLAVMTDSNGLFLLDSFDPDVDVYHLAETVGKRWRKHSGLETTAQDLEQAQE